jgi:hypothetical protein
VDKEAYQSQLTGWQAVTDGVAQRSGRFFLMALVPFAEAEALGNSADQA